MGRLAAPGAETVELEGRGEAERELSLPFHGRRLRGDALHDQLDTWVADGVMEPSAAEAVRLVMANPDWLRLEGRIVAVLGAGAEMGPLQALLHWGADVTAVDLAVPNVWERVAAAAYDGAGTVRVLVRPGGSPGSAGPVRTSSPRCRGWAPGSSPCRARSSSATTCTPTGPPTCGCRRRSTPGRWWPRRHTGSCRGRAARHGLEPGAHPRHLGDEVRTGPALPGLAPGRTRTRTVPAPSYAAAATRSQTFGTARSTAVTSAPVEQGLEQGAHLGAGAEDRDDASLEAQPVRVRHHQADLGGGAA